MFKYSGKLMTISFIIILATLWFYGYIVYPSQVILVEETFTQKVLGFLAGLVALLASLTFIINLLVFVYKKVTYFFMLKDDNK